MLLLNLIACRIPGVHAACQDRKSTRLNSSHSQISYAVFCLKKKKNKQTHYNPYCTLAKFNLTIVSDDALIDCERIFYGVLHYRIHFALCLGFVCEHISTLLL